VDKPGLVEFDAELAALVGQLQAVENRIVSLTGGQVDVVLDPTGRAHLLAKAQQRLLASEEEQRRAAAAQTAVLNALPAHVALLDAQGHIVSVNEAWKRFAASNGLRDDNFGVGIDYAGVCEAAVGLGAAEAPAAARGLRAVLAGDAPAFSLEYPCHSPDEQRWYRMTVTPLDGARPAGAVVMHVDISERKRAEAQAQQLADRLTSTLESLTDGFCTLDLDWRFTYVNSTAEKMLARPRAELLGGVLWTLFPGGADSAIGQALQRAMTEQGAVQLVERYPPFERWLDLRIYGSAQGLAVYARDVTRQRRQAAQLEAERLRLVQAQAVAHIGSWQTDLATGAVFWSAETHRIFETDEQTFVPTHERFLALVHPDDRAAVDAAFVASAGLLAPQSIEHRVPLADGRVKTVEERWQVFRNAEGTPVQALGTCQDITGRKQAEELLRRSQAMVQLAGHMARLGAWSVDLPSMTVHWSDVVAAIHEEPAGISPTVEAAIAYYAPEHRDIMSAHVTRCVQEGTPFDLELQIVTATGRRRWVRAIGQPDRDDTGRVVRVQGAFQEISDRKEAEQAAHELAHRLQSTLESITDGLFTLDGAWRFTYVNSQAERLLGRSRESLIGRSMWDEYAQAVGSVAQQHYERAVRDHVPVAFEYEYPPLQKWFEINAYPSSQGLAVYFRDVSDRKRDQDALRELNAELEARVEARTAELSRAREEAEHASRAKSAFLAAMSHEIRTPMNGVIGMVDVLHQSSLRGHQVEMVNLIRDSAYSLLGIIEDILDISKIEAGRMEIERAPMRLADIVEGVCGMLDHMAIKRDVRMALFVDPAIPPWLVGDEARLRQVLVNLVGNAIKFCAGRERPGRMTVRARLRQSEHGSATVELSVADNGIGMDEATVARLFTPFTQGDASTTRRFGGTGLGLAISATLVGLMGGEISVASALGQGATFSVVLTLPCTEGEVPVEPAAALVAGLRCCIVGSDMPLVDDVAAYLAAAGASVERAWDASAAGAAPLWILLPSQNEVPIETLRSLARQAGSAQTRFFKLGSGYRRRPRLEPPDLVLLDHCGLTRRSLYRVVGLASGRLVPEAVDLQPSEGAPPAAAKGVRRRRLPEGRQILVAEDNETNRKVIQQQLYLAGFDAEIAEDGQQALDLWRSGDFGLVFTDLHMPRMDGYALAACIRAEERAKGARRTTIVALTANALRDEERRCRAAGMDAYLSKPVRLTRLQAAIEEWLAADDGLAGQGAEPTGVAGGTEVNAPAAQPLVDLSVLKALVGDDEAVVAEVLRVFCDTATECSDVLAQAFAKGDLRGVADVAHKLKSGARSIGALQLGERCSELEAAAGAGQNDTASTLLALLANDLRSVIRILEVH
jgi:PAS domain S-box-containing protein